MKNEAFYDLMAKYVRVLNELNEFENFKFLRFRIGDIVIKDGALRDS